MAVNQKGFQTVNLHSSASGTIATPVIGENGNWFIGNDDTGIKAQGETGPKGDTGDMASELAALEAKVGQLSSDLTIATATAVAGGAIQRQDGGANIYDYPSGYNKTNCWVLSVMIYRLSSDTYDSHWLTASSTRLVNKIEVMGVTGSTFIPGKILILLKHHNLIN